MKNVTIYTKDYCPYCKRAKALLDRKGVAYTDIDVTYDAELQEEMIRRSGRRTVPQVFIGDVHVGGNDDLVAAERSGELDSLLGRSEAA